ncbi:MAG: YdjY domain-containing protein [Planctomycetota bacterium]
MIAPALWSCALLASAQPEGRADAFPGIVIDYDARAVELTGFVPIDAHSEATPNVIVEAVAEAGGIRDHEALVRIDAEARHVHAALLLLGLEPGVPGAILADGTRAEPEGPEIIVTAKFERDGERIEEPPTEWVHDPETNTRLDDNRPVFRFGGSSEREFNGATFYMAEAEGVVIGLSTFGSGDADSFAGIETIGLAPVFSPDAASGDPIWMADPDRIPIFETPVTLVLTPAEPGAGDDPEP